MIRFLFRKWIQWRESKREPIAISDSKLDPFCGQFRNAGSSDITVSALRGDGMAVLLDREGALLGVSVINEGQLLDPLVCSPGSRVVYFIERKQP